MAKRETWEKRTKARNLPVSIEITVNNLIQDMFRDMVQKNACTDGKTLKLSIDGREGGYVAVGNNFYPEAIYKNGRNTTVKWKNGTHTTVKRAEGTVDDDYNAFTAALAIKVIGNNTTLKKMIAKKLIVQKKKEKKTEENHDPD